MQKKIKNLILIAITFLWGYLLITASPLSAQGNENPFHYAIPSTSISNSNPDTSIDRTTNIGEIITTNAVKPESGLLQRIMKIFWLDSTDYTGNQKALHYIKKLLNYALGFVSFIAFMLVLYAFYMMLIGDGEKGWEKVKSTLKGVAIAIIVMSLAWLIVSMLFWIYESQAIPK